MTQSETIFFCVILKIRLSPEIGSDEVARPPCWTANFMLRWDQATLKIWSYTRMRQLSSG